jgi:hypothetical protein
MKPALIKHDQFLTMVQEAAYYRWLNGSSDTEANWYDAVSDIADNYKIKKVVDPTEIPRKLTAALVENQLVLK